MSKKKPCRKCGKTCSGEICMKCKYPQRYCKSCGVRLCQNNASNLCTHCFGRFNTRKCAACGVSGPGTTREIQAKGWAGALRPIINAQGKVKRIGIWLCPKCFTPERLIAEVKARIRGTGAG